MANVPVYSRRGLDLGDRAISAERLHEHGGRMIPGSAYRFSVLSNWVWNSGVVLSTGCWILLNRNSFHIGQLINPTTRQLTKNIHHRSKKDVICRESLIIRETGLTGKIAGIHTPGWTACGVNIRWRWLNISRRTIITCQCQGSTGGARTRSGDKECVRSKVFETGDSSRGWTRSRRL